MIAAIIAKTRKYTRIFKNNQATSPANSILPGDHGIRHTFVFDRMVRRGIIIKTGGDRYYLDEIKEEKLRHARRKFLFLSFISVLICGIALYFIARFSQ